MRSARLRHSQSESWRRIGNCVAKPAVTNRVFAFSTLAALINYSATFAMGFLLSLSLQYIQNLSPQSSGFVLIAAPVIMAVFSPFAGRLSDRIEPRIVSSIGMTLTTIGLLILSFLEAETSLGFIWAARSYSVSALPCFHPQIPMRLWVLWTGSFLDWHPDRLVTCANSA